MNRKGLALSVVLLATVGAASAFAAAGHFGKGQGRHGHGGWQQAHFGGEHGGMMKRGRHGMRGGKGGMMQLKRLDADNDGAVTLDEFLKPRQDRFAEMDANKDGFLDADELTARMRQMADQRQRMMMAKLDADGDGKVTREEFDNASRHGRRGMREERGGGRYGWHRGRHGGGRGMDETEKGAAGNDVQGMQDGDDGSRMEGRRGRGGRGERGAWRQKRFERMDANGDGVITIEDLQTRSAERNAYAKKKKLHVLDKDGDGKVSADEFLTRAKQRFADKDLDMDGKITAADLPPGMAERWAAKSASKSVGEAASPAVEEKK